MIESVIAVGFAAAFVAQRPSRDVYDRYEQKSVREKLFVPQTTYLSPENVPSVSTSVSWAVAEQALLSPQYPISPYAAAFRDIGLLEEVGQSVLATATEFVQQSYPVVKIEPHLSTDYEESVSYLTLRLYVDQDFERAMEMDSALTSFMVGKYGKLPDRLSLMVYESESISA